MQTKRTAQDYSEILHWNDIFSSVYLPLLLHYLYYKNLLFTIGSIDNIRYILILTFLEIVKYIFYISKSKTVSHKQNSREFLKPLLTVILLFACVYMFAILFGAPAFSHFQETFMFSLLTTTLTGLPLCMHFGAEEGVTMLLSITSSENSVIRKLFMLKVRLAILGAWLGAIVIPLDWNRPWQDWPTPCCVGTILGYTLATWICAVLQYRYYSKSDKKTDRYTL